MVKDAVPRARDDEVEEEYDEERSQTSIVSIHSSEDEEEEEEYESADEESDDESVRVAAPAKPRTKSRVVLSDDSDIEEVPPPTKTKAKSQTVQSASDSQSTSDPESDSRSDVVEAAPPPKAKPTRRVPADSDSDIQETGPPPKTKPLTFPVPQPAKTSTAKAGPSFPIPEPARPPPATIKPLPKPALPAPARNYNPPTAPKVVALDWAESKALATQKMPGAYIAGTGPSMPRATPIAAPATGATKPAAPLPRAPNADDDDFSLPGTQEERWEPTKTKADAEKDIQDLFASAMNSDDTRVDMTRAHVKGLAHDVVLKTHQVISRDWMKAREEGKKAGGILADDMGLGKTLQTIVRIVDGHEKGQPPTLIVTPTSVVPQWVSEIETMAPGLRVMAHSGPSRTKDKAVLERYNVIVTSFATVQAEHKAHTGGAAAKPVPTKKKAAAAGSGSSSEAEHFGRKLAAKRAPASRAKKFTTLFNVEFYRVVLDEAHTIKNRSAQTTKACWALQSRKRWCLTGTPMQNGVEELYPLINFIGVRPYNDWDRFNIEVVKPIKAGRSGTALKRLHVVLKGIMLRRLKTDTINGKPIIELPARDVAIVHCEFDADERAFYDALAAKIEIAVSKFQRAGTAQSNYTAILTLLLRLRQACNHPGLVTKDFSKDKDAIETKAADENKDDPLKDDEADELADALAGLTVDRKCTICFSPLTSSNSARADKACADCSAQIAREKEREVGEYENPSLPPTSAKIRKIIRLLKDTRNEGDEKTIVFSQFTSFLDVLEEFLAEEDIKHVRLDGSMKMEDREASLKKIKESDKCRVILVSFKAGSTGLNLTCCSRVILVDLWWNPALEEQAFDRAHRLGQKRDVKISKLTIENTVEERILELQEKKREIARAALSGDKIKGNKLSMDELMNLFKPNRHDTDDEDN